MLLRQKRQSYAAPLGGRIIELLLTTDGPFTLQVNNRADKGPSSSGNVLRFKQLSVDAEYTLNTIKYTYDAASRVLGADYYSRENTASTPVQTFAYGYDVAGQPDRQQRHSAHDHDAAGQHRLRPPWPRADHRLCDLATTPDVEFAHDVRRK